MAIKAELDEEPSEGPRPPSRPPPGRMVKEERYIYIYIYIYIHVYVCACVCVYIYLYRLYGIIITIITITHHYY